MATTNFDILAVNSLLVAGTVMTSLPLSSEVESADGAIASKHAVVVITKTGTLAALTLAAPVVGTDDFKRLTIVSTTALAHTVTNSTPGFNNGGAASDVATFAAAIGNAMELIAYQGVWYTVNLKGVTLA